MRNQGTRECAAQAVHRKSRKREAVTATVLAVFRAFPGLVSLRPLFRIMYIMFNLRWVGHLVGLWVRSKFGKPARPYIEARI